MYKSGYRLIGKSSVFQTDVMGSNPIIRNKACSSAVERTLDKRLVGGSNPLKLNINIACSSVVEHI